MTKRGFAIVGTVAVMYLLVFAVAACFGDQPDCTGDRHYDECGDFCPMATTTTTVDPPAPTTTTLDESGCGQCPTVYCGGGIITNNTTITVNRCPAVTPLMPCRYVHTKNVAKLVKRGYKLIPTSSGLVACPKPNYHGRVLMTVGQ